MSFVTQKNLQTFIPKLDKIESSRLEFLSLILTKSPSLIESGDRVWIWLLQTIVSMYLKVGYRAMDHWWFLAYYDKLAHLFNYDDGQLEIWKIENKNSHLKVYRGSPRLAVILSKLILEKHFRDCTVAGWYHRRTHHLLSGYQQRHTS